jgi:cobyrinic acid a,c-diamide synthase
MERILFAGTHSSVGKTTVVAAVLAALKSRGYEIIPFKVGPDYIDPGFHTLACGNTAGNLDSWMYPHDQVREVLSRRVPAGAMAVIEGVMGLYDGRKGRGEEGSTAQVAKITGTPVILVVSGAKMARSAAALVGGYINFDTGVRFAGVIFNQVSGPSHYSLLREAVECNLGLPVLGYLPRDLEIAVKERHLGLQPAVEVSEPAALLAKLALMAEQTLDLDAILAAAASAGSALCAERTVFPAKNITEQCVIAVAKDEAFHFYYHENLELLQAYGARLAEFSPLHDRELPAGCSGVYLGGGFPEMFARQLSENTAMLQSIASAVAAGMPVYAECGGYMYLCRELADCDGQSYPLTGVFPGRALMRSRRQALGYVEVSAREKTFFLDPGEVCRGHEFHWSEMVTGAKVNHLYHRMSTGEACGETVNNCAASYIHLHWLSNPAIARRFVGACAAFTAERECL